MIRSLLYTAIQIIIAVYSLTSAAYRNPPSKPEREQDSEGTFLGSYTNIVYTVKIFNFVVLVFVLQKFHNLPHFNID